MARRLSSVRPGPSPSALGTVGGAPAAIATSIEWRAPVQLVADLLPDRPEGEVELRSVPRTTPLSQAVQRMRETGTSMLVVSDGASSCLQLAVVLRVFPIRSSVSLSLSDVF